MARTPRAGARHQFRVRGWPRTRAIRLLTMAITTLTLGTVGATIQPLAASAISRATPKARSFGGTPAVGVVLPRGMGSRHTCVGSVIRDQGADVVLTAAHCLSGTTKGVQFAPGYHDGVAPYGVWTVSAAYVDPRWISVQDPRADYAFLVMAPLQRQGRMVHLHDVIRGNVLGTAPPKGRGVTVIAYAAGLNDKPITCSTKTYLSGRYPAFDCHGFVGGTSGGPWLAKNGTDLVVQGIIGGLHQGGCFEYTSYSPPFDRTTVAVFRRAQRGAAPDALPRRPDDGC